MSVRLDIENPFYDNNASGSAFGWDFQVNAAIFLFLKYIDEIESIKVEGKYQDIEIKKTNNHFIYAQAKSIQDGSLTNRMSKLEDAIISLSKTPATEDDSLLYISNYSAPIKDSDVFKNQVLSLQNVKNEQKVFIEQKKKIEDKLTVQISQCKNETKKKKLKELKKRIENIDADRFLVASIYPYLNTEQKDDKYQVIIGLIQDLLTRKFGISSPNIFKFIYNLLYQWHETFLCNATIPERDREKTKTKMELLWQIVVIISNMDIDMSQLFEEELEQDHLDEFEMYYNQKLFIHERFSFFNNLQSDLVTFLKTNKGKKDIDFIKEKWTQYKDEFREFQNYEDLAQEYLIKKCLYKLIKNKNNIKKIVEGRKNDY